MTFVVTESCVMCKNTDCVNACPAECFYEGENMLVIKPEECIDCGICEPECPAGAILPGTDPRAEDWFEHNRKYAAVWPNISRQIAPMPEAETFKDMPGKLAAYFSAKPGTGT